jgi:hypothetical protein
MRIECFQNEFFAFGCTRTALALSCHAVFRLRAEKFRVNPERRIDDASFTVEEAMQSQTDNKKQPSKFLHRIQIWIAVDLFGVIRDMRWSYLPPVYPVLPASSNLFMSRQTSD